ncbi:hypothetical protein S40293_00258 [Stachybotrys chartarum IBT 40293]|nr:hypothetical protein S40293_00258 [Stachybotrys chartarum IBT 40293]KFA73213.1 hypothetical protein S40288_05395 [Stachybotrys chartarum IBT 40288]
MKLGLLFLTSLPSALGVSIAMLAYSPPAEVITRAETSPECILPRDYHVQNFTGYSNDTGTTISSFDFTFADTATNVTTLCHFNSTSTSTTPPSLTPRFACENSDVKFIWENPDRQIWMIERVCSLTDGAPPTYEASGSLNLHLSCSTNGTCVSNSTEYTALFTSLQPVRDPTLLLV